MSDCLTIDGRIVTIRPVTAADAPALLALHERMSAHNRYLRFFSAGAALGTEISRLTRPADDDHLALLVQHRDIVLAAGSYERMSAAEADFALIVDDEHHGEGLGTLLLEHLAAAARRAGIAVLVGDVLPDNHPMLRVSGGLAPNSRPAFADGVAQVRVPTLPDEAALAAVGERDRTSAHRSLRPLLAPSSIAVIGAGRRPGGAGHEILAALVSGEYPGDLYAINPHAGTVCGIATLPSVSTIGEPIDLAVVAVPARAVREVIDACCLAGVGAAVILTSDLSAALRSDLVRTARRHGVRLVGPSSLGVLNTDPVVRLTATVGVTLPAAGGLAVASQSGAVGIAILNAAATNDIGVSTFVSLGDKADVSGNDLLAYWYDDPATQAVALYLESFGNPRRFAWTARALARRKPVLAVKGGRRSGAAADALFDQAGVIRTDTLGDLLDAARVLVGQPLPAGPRLAVVGNAGGLSVLATDAAEAADLVVPVLSDATRAQLGRDPADLGTGATPTAIADAVRTVARSAETDMLVVSVVATRTNDSAATLHRLGAVLDEFPRLPAAVVVVGARDAPTAVGARRVPVFTLPENAVRALGRAARYAAWRRRPLGGRPDLTGVDRAGAHSIVGHALAGGDGWQAPEVGRALVRAYGIPVTPPAAPPGVDLVAGVVHDVHFGSLVTLRPGGTSAASADDRVLRLLPLTDLDAAGMWRSLRSAPLLCGHEGALEDLLLRLGRLAEDFPEIAELELDPAAADVRLRLAVVGGEPDPYLRDLLANPGRI